MHNVSLGINKLNRGKCVWDPSERNLTSSTIMTGLRGNKSDNRMLKYCKNAIRKENLTAKLLPP